MEEPGLRRGHFTPGTGERPAIAVARSSTLERMLRRGIFLALDFPDVRLDRSLDAPGLAQKILHGFRFLPRVNFKHVVQDQHLARAVHAGPDTYGRSGQLSDHLPPRPGVKQ